MQALLKAASSFGLALRQQTQVHLRIACLQAQPQLVGPLDGLVQTVLLQMQQALLQLA